MASATSGLGIALRSWQAGAPAREPYRVRLRVYEGPLDLLLFLVRRNEVDICHVSLAELADQFLEYIRLMRVLDIELAGDFLVVAATLAYIKSKKLLPVEEKEDEEDEAEEQRLKEELAWRLAEYRKFRQSAEELRRRIRHQADYFPRNTNGNGKHDGNGACLEPVSIFDIVAIFKDMLERAEERAPSVIEKETLTVAAKMEEIERKVWEALAGVTFEELVPRGASRMEVIVTFLAVLELVYVKRIVVEQREPLGPIRIYPGPRVSCGGLARS